MSTCLDFVGQFDTPFIVDVDHTRTRFFAKTSVEEPLLRVKVIVHRVVVIKMILRKIREERHFESQPVAAMQVDGLRMLHRRHFAAGIDGKKNLLCLKPQVLFEPLLAPPILYSTVVSIAGLTAATANAKQR